jgi:DNA-binding NarL/FixJ family response regulator
MSSTSIGQYDGPDKLATPTFSYVIWLPSIGGVNAWHSNCRLSRFLPCTTSTSVGKLWKGRTPLKKVRKLRPDIVLLDINMPVMNVIQAAYEIRQIAPYTKVIFFTIHDAPETAAAIGPLADEFIPKSAAGAKLIPAIKRLLQT